MSDEKKPFTVTDRRHFSADGTVRSESETAAGEAQGQSKAGGPRDEAPVDAAGPGDVKLPPSAERPPDFSGLLLSLGAQAGMLLEGGVAPDGEPLPPDLAGARQIIGILEMLRDKTEGRRTPEETRILDGLLYELRMGFLARSGVVGA